MRNKNKLYIAMQGTFTPTEVVEFSFDNRTFWKRFKSRWRIRKQLKKTDVVLTATTDIIKQIKIKFTLVLPDGNMENMNWYRDRDWLNPGIKYLYPIMRKKYKDLVRLEDTLLLKRFMLLENYLRKEK